MAYLKRHKSAGRYVWTLTPPDDIIEAGLVSRRTFKDGRTANAARKYLERIVRDFRAGKLPADIMPDNPTLRVLAAHYLDTSHFNSLSSNTRDIYRNGFNLIFDTRLGNRCVGDMKLSEFNSQLCSKIYDYWVKNYSVPWANEKKRLWGILYSHAMSLDLVERNPMASVRPVKHEANTSLWTREQVEKFLETAFSDFKYRPIGLLVLLCYEYGQRPVDIANLRWDNCDFDTDTITIKQRKRGATVELPMSPQIKEMLLQQKEDFDFQEYVLPYLRVDQAWRPMTIPVWTNLANQVKELAGLPSELQIRGLRTTAITEMVEAGVDSIQIKQVSGHKNINSLNPYIKNTRAGAKMALDARRK